WGVAAAEARGDHVTLYTVDRTGATGRRELVATGALPIRMAAADLDGDGRDDLVAAADLGRSLTVAFQRADGTFAPGPTLPTGRAPSELLLTDLDGRDGLDIVVAEQGAGQVRVYYNDAGHAFARSARFRAGFGPYGFNQSSGVADVSALEQTV